MTSTEYTIIETPGSDAISLRAPGGWYTTNRAVFNATSYTLATIRWAEVNEGDDDAFRTTDHMLATTSLGRTYLRIMAASYLNLDDIARYTSRWMSTL